MVGRTSYYAAKLLTFMRGQDVIALADGVVLAGGGDLIENQHLREGKNNRTVYRLYLTDQQGDWTLEPSPPPVLYTRIAPAADSRLIAFTGPLYELNKGRRRLSSAAMFNAGLHIWPLERFLAAAKALQKNSPIDKDLTARRGMLVMRNPHQVEAFDDLDRSGAQWQKPELDVNATALSADAVLVAHATGSKDLYGYHFDEQTQRQPMAQFDGWQLSALRRENGETLWAVPLPAEPLYNGLAVAADGTVIVTLRDGASVAVGKQE
jgi:hypothetical protein